jgi:hypothetical protein
MPQWSVTGADRKSGKEVSLLVEAPSEPKAREVASARGILVAEVRLSDPDTVAPATLAYQPAGASQPRRYRSLLWAARLFRVVALLLLMVSVLLVFSATGRARSVGPTAFVPAVLTPLLQDLALHLTGIAAALLSSGLCRMAHRYATSRLA